MADEVKDKRDWHFTIVDNSVVFCSSIGTYEKLTYMVLCAYANVKTGECYPSIKTISELISASENTVRKSLKGLQEKKLISITTRKSGTLNQSNLYTILEIPLWIKQEYENFKTSSTSCGEGGVLHVVKGVSSRSEGGTSPDEGRVLQEVKGGTSPGEDELEPFNYNITTTTAEKNTPVDNVDKIKQVIKMFNENIETSTPIQIDQITKWCSEVEIEVVMTAITEAVMYNARSMAYIKSLINDWKGKGIKTKAALDAYKLEVEKEKAAKKSKQQGKKKQDTNDGTMMVGDRKYNTKDLEDNLLGRKRNTFAGYSS